MRKEEKEHLHCFYLNERLRNKLYIKKLICTQILAQKKTRSSLVLFQIECPYDIDLRTLAPILFHKLLHNLYSVICFYLENVYTFR